MDAKKVIVTGIGGNVGQGIIRNIKASGFLVTIIGTNIEDFSAGNHLCDAFYKVPYAYEANYIEIITAIVEKEKVNLIIPSTDFEVYYLSKYKSQIPCEIVVSLPDTTSNYLDKYLTYQHLAKYDIPFAKSILPSHYKDEFKDIILKPRKGRGSRGIVINPKELSSYPDDEYMIQELIKGIEITTAFYVTKRGDLHGFITFERSLENGATTHCKVISEYDEKLKELLDKLISKSNFQGSANVQSIVTEDGTVIPFEINCRISGTNSIRANFGFKDVEYTLAEWLYNVDPEPPKVTKGVATRILMDVIYEDVEDFSEAKDNSTSYFIY